MTSRPPDTRYPDFVVIGAMKAGTTSLFRWLGQQPGVTLPSEKEPEILLRPGDPAQAYGRLLTGIGVDQLTGEASTRYGHPDHAGPMAATVASWLPDARLIYLVRDPVARLRSHYRHQYQRGRERRSLAEAVTEPANPYVAHSCYADVVGAVRAELGAAQLHVYSFERLVGDDGTTWSDLLTSLGLSPSIRPTTTHNADEVKGQFRPWMRVLHDRGMLPGRLGPLRRLRRLAIDDSDASRLERDAAAAAPLPDAVVARLAEQSERLRSLLRDPTIV